MNDVIVGNVSWTTTQILYVERDVPAIEYDWGASAISQIGYAPRIPSRQSVFQTGFGDKHVKDQKEKAEHAVKGVSAFPTSEPTLSTFGASFAAIIPRFKPFGWL
jgi:hypothetical protein